MKSNGNIFAIAFKSEKERQHRDSWNRVSKKNQRTDTKKDAKRIRSDNFKRSSTEKSNTAIAILEI